MRNMIHDSKVRARANIVALFKTVLSAPLRARANGVPPVKETLESSVVWGPQPFQVVSAATSARVGRQRR